MLDKSQLSNPIGQNSNLSAEEIAKFDALAEQWWDPEGKYKTALAFNAARTDYMVKHIATQFGRDPKQASCLQGLRILDVGCGGGLISEALASKGAEVTGIDASATSIEVAKRHALQSGLSILYRHVLSPQLIQEGESFDVVINAEVVEHVPDQVGLIRDCCELVAENGVLVLATLNRTVLSFVIAIVGAEYILGYLPKGTHAWREFVKPRELCSWAKSSGMALIDQAGLKLNPLSGCWSQTSSLAVNYMQIYRQT